jgi:hypothetical protein
MATGIYTLCPKGSRPGAAGRSGQRLPEVADIRLTTETHSQPSKTGSKAVYHWLTINADGGADPSCPGNGMRHRTHPSNRSPFRPAAFPAAAGGDFDAGHTFITPALNAADRDRACPGWHGADADFASPLCGGEPVIRWRQRRCSSTRSDFWRPAAQCLLALLCLANRKVLTSLITPGFAAAGRSFWRSI